LSFLIRISVVAVLALGLGAAGAFVYLHVWASSPLPLTDAAIVELEPGESFSRFAARLQSSGVVAPAWLFTTFARLNGDTSRIQAGEYRIVPGETPQQFLADLVAGAVATYEVRIVEGNTIERVVQQLAVTPKLKDDVGPVAADALMSRLGREPGPAEGQFFPDTYEYTKGTRTSEILLRANERMRSVLEREWATRAAGLPYTTPNDALIMASIIEKETGRDEDRAKISRVFVSRLQQGMRLQTDPAVIYGLGAAFDGNLTRAHLDTDNPYNTYLHSGLPPTPIALPGLASIQAALHPDANDYLYFVARGDGSSEFSATLEQHVAAVRRYQLQGGQGGQQ
jgi:UPF0755 protein